MLLTTDPETRDRLHAVLSDTLAQLRALGVRVSEPSDVGDEVDAIVSTDTLEMGLAARERLSTRAAFLRLAIERFDQGSYGLCVRCQDPIAPARLAAQPEALRCITCAERIERRGTTRRLPEPARLGFYRLTSTD